VAVADTIAAYDPNGIAQCGGGKRLWCLDFKRDNSRGRWASRTM